MQINNLPSDICLDEKHGRLAILVEGFGWVHVPWQESQFRVVWEKYLEARRLLKSEDVVEDFILQEPIPHQEQVACRHDGSILMCIPPKCGLCFKTI